MYRNIDNAKEEGWVVSSESCSFLSIGAKFVREVRPGEIIEFTRRGPQTICIVDRPEGKNAAFCIFEYVYFARADSILEGKELSAYNTHKLSAHNTHIHT